MNPSDQQGPAAVASPPSFESALVDLQQIVGELEAGTLGLEDALKQYERGAGLLRHCYSLLESAERRIEILTGRTEEGDPATAPFDATATHEPAASKAGRRARPRATKRVEEPDNADDPEALF
ncbi:MAG: exodeoxyribonuclease VII small subunit [Planctomycetaceae bacterium]|nr:exodeoxyribonuclease VII small subunit [Planctomycetaceae bacterium]